MNFNINDNNFKLITKDEKIIDFFKLRLKNSNENSNNYIAFNNNIEMVFKNKKLKIDGVFDKSDLYQIYNNYLSMIFNDEKNCYIHSVVISKNNKGILLLGTFGSGKTTLAINSKKYGYEMNSADHSVLSITDDKLYMVYGSRYVKHDDGFYNLDEVLTNKKVEIKNIVMLYGLSNNGDLSVDNVLEKHFIKKMYNYCSWHFSNPISTNIDEELYNSKNNIVCFLNNVLHINIPTYIVRGDSNKIIKYFVDK